MPYENDALDHWSTKTPNNLCYIEPGDIGVGECIGDKNQSTFYWDYELNLGQKPR